MKEYLQKMIAQEQEALRRAEANDAGEEVRNAIRRRLNNFINDLKEQEG